MVRTPAGGTIVALYGAGVNKGLKHLNRYGDTKEIAATSPDFPCAAATESVTFQPEFH